MKNISHTLRLVGPDQIERLKKAHEEFPLISIQEVVKKYGVPMRTLRRWQAKGLMPKREKHGRWLKYKKQDVEACIKQNRRSEC